MSTSDKYGDIRGRCIGCISLRDFDLSDDIKTCISLNIRIATSEIRSFGCTLFEERLAPAVSPGTPTKEE